MDTDAPAAAPPEGDVAAPTEAAPVVRTFALAPSVWAEEEDEPITEERQRQYDELAEKYKSRAERFGTEARDPHTQSPSLLDGPLGSGGGSKPRLSRLELMQKRREEAQKKRPGFATGFDILSPEEEHKRKERAQRYGNSLLGVTADDVPRVLSAQELLAKKAARAAKYGIADEPASGSGLDIDTLEPRRDALSDALVRHECVHLYGVDVLSTAECMAYFGEYAPVFVEWINDSSCNVVFADAFTAKRAMYGKGVPETSQPTVPAAVKPDDETPMEAGEGDTPAAPPPAADADGDMAMAPAGGSHAECFWFKGLDFMKQDGIAVPLCFRLATTDDVKPDGKTVSRYLWCGGQRPAPPPRRNQNSGRKRRRGRGADDDEGEALDAPAAPELDLREALKRRREAAAAEPGDMEQGEEAMAGGAEEPTAADAPPPEVLPPGDLRAQLKSAVPESAMPESAVPDFGNDLP